MSKKLLITPSFIVTPNGNITELAKGVCKLSYINGAALLSGILKCLIFLQVKSAISLLFKSVFHIYAPSTVGSAKTSSNFALTDGGISA